MRRMERNVSVIPHNALTVVAEVPTGVKWEIINLAVAADGTNAYEWYIFILVGGATYYGLDEITVPAGKFFVNRSYQSVVLEAGDSLVAWPVTAGTADEAMYTTYVEVFPA